MHQRFIYLEQIMRDHRMPHLRNAISSRCAVELDMPHCVKYEVEDDVVYRCDPPMIHFYPLEEGRNGFQIAYISRENNEADILTFYMADISGNTYFYHADSEGAPITERTKIHLEKELPIMPLPDNFEYDEPEWPDAKDIEANENEDDEPKGPALH